MKRTSLRWRVIALVLVIVLVAAGVAWAAGPLATLVKGGALPLSLNPQGAAGQQSTAQSGQPAAAGQPGGTGQGARPQGAAQGGQPAAAGQQGTRPQGAGGSGGTGAQGAAQGGQPAAAGQQGARPQGAGGTGAPAGARSGGRAAPVEVMKAPTGMISQTFSYAGALQARDSVRVTPLVSGRIESVKVAVGDVVKSGDVLAQIETATLQAQVAQAQAAYVNAQQRLARQQIGARPEEITAAQAAVTAAQVALYAAANPNDDQRKVASANLEKTTVALQQAQREYDKVATAPNIGMMAQSLNLQQATINYESALASYNLAVKPADSQVATLQNNLAQAQLKLVQTKQPYLDSDIAQTQASVDQAKAALDLARVSLDNATIRAPFDGVVAEIYVVKGALAGQSSAVALLVSVANVISLDVDESRIGQIKSGMTATLKVSAYPNRTFPATVTAVAPIADTRTHSFAVQLTPVDEGYLLRPGMYADVSLLVTLKQDVVILPMTTIALVQNKPIVYVIRSDNTAELRQVTIGLSDPTRAEILSGVRAGETVVTAGQSTLANGMSVTITRGG